MTIDFLNCTADDVVARSYAMHPTLFAECLHNAAHIHAQAAATMVDRLAVSSARTMAEAARRVALWAESGELVPQQLVLSERVIAFGIACKLQCVSPALAQAIIGRQ